MHDIYGSQGHIFVFGLEAFPVLGTFNDNIWYLIFDGLVLNSGVDLVPG